MSDKMDSRDGIGESEEVTRCINEGAVHSTPEVTAGRFAAWMAGEEFVLIGDWLEHLESFGAKFDRDQALIVAKLMVSTHQRSNR